MTKKLYLSWTGVGLAILLATGCGTHGNAANASTLKAANQTSGDTATTTGISVGADAPDFSLTKLNGQATVSLKDLLGSKPIILNAFASWCGPCKQEAPDLASLAKQYEGKVSVIGIDMTAEDSVSGAKQFVSDYHLTFPILLDKQGAFLSQYQLVGFPTTFLISPAGKIEAVHVGILTKSQMQSLFQQAVQTKGV
ncbi:TlpA family protein disulfide reductase [Alicyclobacillus ferrooxydans]|uniref:TlpA family protein disulfide reductase n=1 Tax=Alicyclobacillus ferrooxydans TaxID=471514 RepID=UPI0006D5522E|nr:TlpA disulfide reductase family protein [Alicyclobacillus ferrooxydans]